MPLNEPANELTPSDKAPTSDESASETISEDQSRGAVYDFLYHDARRIASFLAQFEAYGSPSQVKATEASARTGTTRASGFAEGRLLGVVKGRGTLERTDSDEERDSAEWTYDPLWRNALRLRDYLDERGMVAQSPTQARIGQFVEATGQLAIGDLGIVRKAWDDPVIRKLIISNAQSASATRQERRAAQAKGQQAGNSDTDRILALLALLPHSLQARLLVPDSYSVWCSLKEENLIPEASDLFLKHGIVIPGEWKIVGILDATPEAFDPVEVVEEPEEPLAEGEYRAGIIGGIAGLFLQNMVGPARLMIGRPVEAFGMTPLMIFREVSG